MVTVAIEIVALLLLAWLLGPTLLLFVQGKTVRK
jgi:hypothetical protein